MSGTHVSGTVIITGGNRGLGLRCAEVLAEDSGWHVVIAGRDEMGAREVARDLSGRTGSGVEAMRLDLGSLRSVRAFARELASRQDLPPLRALVCNAGLQVVNGTTYTDDGFETTFGVNHLGHYLLVNLLLKGITGPARVVFVSSGTHDPAQRTGMPTPSYPGARALAYPDENRGPEEGPGRTGRRRYTTSKLCNVYAVYELSRRLREAGIGAPEGPITVNAFDPGYMPGTALARDYGPVAQFISRNVLPYAVPVLHRLGMHVNTVEYSGESLARLVTDPELEAVSGAYFEGRRAMDSSKLSYDRNNAAELWDTSAELVALKPEETPLRLSRAPA